MENHTKQQITFYWKCHLSVNTINFVIVMSSAFPFAIFTLFIIKNKRVQSSNKEEGQIIYLKVAVEKYRKT